MMPIWSHSAAEAGDLLDFHQEKFDESFMFWGGVTFKGLVPIEAPVFVAGLKKEWEALGNVKSRGVTGKMYAHIITTRAIPAVEQLYKKRETIHPHS